MPQALGPRSPLPGPRSSVPCAAPAGGNGTARLTASSNSPTVILYYLSSTVGAHAIPAESIVGRAHLPPVDGAGEARHRNGHAPARRPVHRHAPAGGGARDQPAHGRQSLSHAPPR